MPKNRIQGIVFGVLMSVTMAYGMEVYNVAWKMGYPTLPGGFSTMTNEVFVENVAEGRSMSLDEARARATSLPFTGEQAVENGLADEVGVFDDAIEAAAQLAGLGSDYNVITLTQSSDLGSLMDLLSESDSDSATSAAAAKLIELLKNEGVLS